MPVDPQNPHLMRPGVRYCRVSDDHSPEAAFSVEFYDLTDYRRLTGEEARAAYAEVQATAAWRRVGGRRHVEGTLEYFERSDSV